MSGTRLQITDPSTTSRSFSMPTRVGDRAAFAPGSFVDQRLQSRDRRRSPTQAFYRLHLRTFATDFPAERSSFGFHIPGWPRVEWLKPQHSATLHRVMESWDSAPTWGKPCAGSALRRQSLPASVAEHKPERDQHFRHYSSITENFLTQFKNAQKNLAINQRQCELSIVREQWLRDNCHADIRRRICRGGARRSGHALSRLRRWQFYLRPVQTGQAGAMASTLAGIGGPVPYLCNLVGSSFLPCANNVAVGTYNAAGAGYPINYFQANPYAQGIGSSYTVAEGYSNYNALQVDFRQRAWHGLQFDANYTWSHTLGVATQNNWQGQGAVFSLRNMRLSYGPTLFDLHHVVHINGTYDLPFGRGKQFAGNAAESLIV